MGCRFQGDAADSVIRDGRNVSWLKPSNWRGDQRMEPIYAAVIDRLREMHQQYFEYMDGLTSEELDWSPGPEMNSLCVLGVHVAAAERFWIGLGIDDV